MIPLSVHQRNGGCKKCLNATANNHCSVCGNTYPNLNALEEHLENGPCSDFLDYFLRCLQ